MGLLGESARRRKHLRVGWRLRLPWTLNLPALGCEQPAFLSFQTKGDWLAFVMQAICV
jgi:hypothetical protein